MESPYPELLKRLKRLNRLESIGSLIGWDEQVNLPPASGPLRGEQRGLFTEITFREAAHPEIGELIQAVEEEAATLTPEQQAVVRDARRGYDQVTRIPAAFAARRAEAQTRSFHAWVEARKNNQFAAFQPYLEEQLAFAKEQAGFFEVPDPYDYWVDQFDPGMQAAVIEPLFEQLKPELKSLIETISSTPEQPDPSLLKGFPVADQEAFLRDVVRAFGFDFSRGRIDVAVHPFCGGHPLDTRMTTRFDPDNPLDSLSSSMHETGHALYEQGLQDAYAGSALGEAVGMAVHESQSRIWENQVGRSREFWQYWEPRYRERFPSQLEGISPETLYRTVNRVAVTPIRVDADEVTYNLHIMLRFHLEKGLFDGSIQVADLPEAWNAASREILGYQPKNDAEGCLQDVHWSGGMFGYFPSYCLGNLIAAQMWYRILEDLPALTDTFAKGEYGDLLDWLRANVHTRGRRHYTLEFTRLVTGRELSPDFLVRYLKERYLPLYTAS